jgi:beta-lactamase class C
MKIKICFIALLFIAILFAPSSFAGDVDHKCLKSVVGTLVKPVMKNNDIPGMAVGITVDGHDFVFNFGVADKERGKPVTKSTLFEIGSLSKTFTATLVSWAQEHGQLSLSDKTSKYLPLLQGRPFGDVSLLNLGTHTSGGLPLQTPKNITSYDQLLKYFQDWKPNYPPDTIRTYSNPGLGMLGLITAKRLGQDFSTLIETRLFPALGLTHTYFNIPRRSLANYAQGYTAQGEPIRMTADILAPETYGLKSTASDMVHFLDANMGMVRLDDDLLRALVGTHTGYFKAGRITQGLIWEQYSYPVDLKTLLEGTSSQMALSAIPVTKIVPPIAPRQDVFVNKTGSTKGFGAYVAFIPEKHVGVVILANKNYPNDERVTMAYQIIIYLSSVGDKDKCSMTIPVAPEAQTSQNH